jgi:hypothetical protein
MKMLEAARWHMKRGDLIATELTIRRLIRTYPQSVAAADAMRLIEPFLPRLPDSVLAEAPDYAVLRAAILGPSDGPPDGPRAGPPDVPRDRPQPNTSGESSEPPAGGEGPR